MRAHDDEVADALGAGIATVGRVRQRFVDGVLERGLKDGPRSGAMPKLDAKQRAHVIALACSDAPDGHERRTVRMLAGKVVKLGMVDTFNH
jgi:transposase